MLAKKSEEEEEVLRKDWVGLMQKLKKFDITKIVHKTKIPHMGWNSIDLIDRDNPIFIGIENKNRFYFFTLFLY